MTGWPVKRPGSRGILAAILALYVAIAVAYSVVNPLYEATDELRHYRFVRSLVETRRLPIQGQEPCRSQSHHPPLFYALGAVLVAGVEPDHDRCFNPPPNPFWNYRYWEVGVDNKAQYLHGPEEAFPWSGDALAAHLLRFFNVLIGAGVVWLTWALGRLIWPRRPGVAITATALVAFNPMFLYLAGAINNDVIAALGGVALTYTLARLLVGDQAPGWRIGLALGALYGLAVMSKTSLLAMALPAGLVLTWLSWRRGQWRSWLSAGLGFSLAALIIAGPWFGRNLAVYGDLTGFQTLTELWGVRDPRHSFPLALSELPYAWTTLWGRFGFGQIPLPAAIYDGLRWLVGFSLLGWAIPSGRWLRRGSRDRSAPGQAAQLALLVLVALVSGLVWFNYMLVSPAGPMGRFFFPGLPAFALLIGGGLAAWPSLWPHPAWRRALRQALPLAFSGGMLFLGLVALLGFLRPAYARPATFAEGEIPHPLDLRFDSLVRLRGYGLDRTEVQPGQAVTLTLYWEVIGQPPGDYLLFVHLQNDLDLMVAQRDTFTGLGRFPSSQWRPGDRFVERLQVHLPETAYAPDRLRLSVGLYAPGAYRLGVFDDDDGAFQGDAVTLAELALRPAAGSQPNPLQQNFGDDLALVGYAYGARSLEAGDVLPVMFYWEVLRTAPASYHLRLELWDAGGQLRGRSQEPPQEGPTGAWGPGAVYSVTAFLQLAPDLAPGQYELRLALVDPVTGRLQHLLGDDGRWLAEQLTLAPIRIQPGSGHRQPGS